MFFGRDGAGFPEVFPQGLPALGWAARRIPVMHAISKDSLFLLNTKMIYYIGQLFVPSLPLQ